MKMLVAGDWHSELHEQAVYQAFCQLGYDPIRFSWHQYFQTKGLFRRVVEPFYRAQNKYMLGPAVAQLNRDFLQISIENQPQIIFIYRGTHIYPRTLLQLRQVVPRSILIGYNNDDPFSPRYPTWKWRHFVGAVPNYDLVLAYRIHNLDELRAAGARRVDLLRSWFIPERNYPVKLTDFERERYECDVVFIGHYEDDGRKDYLEEIVRRGWRLRIYGPGYEWDPVVRSSALLRNCLPIQLVWGQEYNRALNGAKVALCFFSKLNRDTYTRRCFEIPASGTLLMSEYSDDMATMFRPNEEALYFKNIDQMCQGLERVINNHDERRKIAEAGTRRLWKDGHDIVSRMTNLLALAATVAEEKNEDVENDN